MRRNPVLDPSKDTKVEGRRKEAMHRTVIAKRGERRSECWNACASTYLAWCRRIQRAHSNDHGRPERARSPPPTPPPTPPRSPAK